jgi:hypothetical protein
MGFLPRLLLTILVFPVDLIFIVLGAPVLTRLCWIGYEEQLKQREEAARARKVAEWMAAHPVEAARIAQEQQRRLVIEAEERRVEQAAKLAAQQEERRMAQQALEAALAHPLPEKKAKLLSEMRFPPSLKDLERFARPDGEEDFGHRP